MKKQLAVLILSSLIPTAAMADNFTGASVGMDVETTKYKVKDSDLSGKNTGSAILKGDYGFDMGNNLVGTVEARAKLNSSKAFDDTDIKQRDKYSVGYQQGYRVTKDLMPYAKVEYINSKFKEDGNSTRFNGYGVGVGAKYAVTDNVEVGTEYVYSQLKKDDTKLRGNTVSAGVAYRFK